MKDFPPYKKGDSIASMLKIRVSELPKTIRARHRTAEEGRALQALLGLVGLPRRTRYGRLLEYGPRYGPESASFS